MVDSPSLDVHQALQEPDPHQRLAIGASIIRRLAERSQELIQVLRSAADSDRQLRREWHRWQKGHLWAVQQVVQSLVASKELRDGLSPQAATDTLYFLAGVDGYRLLVVERGWSPDRYEQWLADTGRRLLLRS